MWVLVLTPERVERVRELIDSSYTIVTDAIENHVLADGRDLAAVVILFSGGNDSTVLAHLFRRHANYAAHINTGIGIEQTREFVRDICKAWELPLIEESPPPGNTYEELIMDQGFPGPAHHWKMYQRLKERALRNVRRQLVSNPRRERVVFLAGRRRDESRRRQDIPTVEREGSVVWVSPLANWTALDLNTYRSLADVPRNEVADLIHMSGECLCGAFAKPGELEEIAFWFPEVAEHIHELERKVAAAGQARCQWGWGAYRDKTRSKAGPLCSSCVALAA
ncbi:MAG TPA: phosphoadenosine phosphosulfate reductase family protein [Nitrospira sp.]|nr:phosphoadenosine phosphosulfate reductase family protein [Nitrospira sp.]